MGTLFIFIAILFVVIAVVILFALRRRGGTLCRGDSGAGAPSGFSDGAAHHDCGGFGAGGDCGGGDGGGGD